MYKWQVCNMVISFIYILEFPQQLCAKLHVYIPDGIFAGVNNDAM